MVQAEQGQYVVETSMQQQKGAEPHQLWLSRESYQVTQKTQNQTLNIPFFERLQSIC